MATGLVAFGAVVSLILFYVIGGPFGAINDVGNALIGILSALLAFASRGIARTHWLAIGVAVVGAALTIVGTFLVISETTGFFLAGLWSSVGYAFIGAWLVLLNRSSALANRWPRSLRTAGLLAGAAMLAGVVAVPGILMGVDDFDAVPPWLWIFSVGWLGTYLIYPAWCFWIGRVERR